LSELSLNEVESLALKVGRGAGFAWGLAEDIGRGARALARRGFPWAEALVGLTRDAGIWHAPSPQRVEGWRERRPEIESAAPLCPVRAAALLIDDPSVLGGRPLRLANVGLPLWIAALLAASGKDLDAEWPEASIASIDGLLTPAADVTIWPRAAPRAATSLRRRSSADEAVLAALAAIAARVYVPASESSRARGAGGGSVDDE
jgi:hypothetical protein